jgi:acetyl-CoA/propionyl-CoA carboxylase biotin carboxyl carrier protein
MHTNVEYLRLLVDDPDVRAGRLDTGLIERKLPDMQFRQPGETELFAAGLLAAGGEPPASGAPPWQAGDGWRLGAPAPRRVRLGLPAGPSDPGLATVTVLRQDEGYEAWLDGGTGPANARHKMGSGPELVLDGVAHHFVSAFEAAPPGGGPRGLWLGDGGWSCRLEILDRETRLQRVLAAIQREEGAADPEVRSPMPGTVVSVSVRDGDTVEAGQLLLSVEAMKMEHQLTAALAGTVHLTAGTGDLVKAEQVLATIHPNEEPHTTPKGEEPRHGRL